MRLIPKLNTTATLTLVVLVVGLVCGGGTRNGFIGDVILQLAAIPLLVWCLFSKSEKSHGAAGASQPERVPGRLPALIFCFALVLVPIVQLIPLPLAIWQWLPGRDVIREAFDLIGKPMGPQPISMVPDSTWLALISLIPPIAVFLGVMRLGLSDRRFLSKVIIGFGVVSVVLGLMQLAQGPNSPLRFFEFTNTTEAVGFFANRNHFAALLYVVMIFAAAWVIEALSSVRGLTRESVLHSPVILVLAATFVIFIALLIGQTMARSRAGLLLTIAGLFAVLALAFTGSQGREAGSRTVKIVFGAVAFAIVFSLQFALYRILERFDQDPLEGGRVMYARNTYELAKAYLPLGTGMGTFVPIYAMHEKPADLIPSFANRAHNDVLEVSLESGVLGIALMLVFALWLLRKIIKVWRKSGDLEAQDIDIAMMKAATISLCLLAAHSFVDYPLRTGAMMVLAAFCCGLLIPPPRGLIRSERASRSQTPTATMSTQEVGGFKKGPLQDRPQVHAAPAKAVRPRQLWQTDKQWPESWTAKDASQKDVRTSETGKKEEDKNEKDKKDDPGPDRRG